MAQRAESIEAEQAASADIIAIATSNPIVVLTDKDQFNTFYARMKEEADSLVADASTNSGRDAIKALAYKVSQTKAAIEKARLSLTEGWRTQTATVNAAGKDIAASLDALRAEIRAPLDAWQKKDDARVAACQAMITRLSHAAVVQLADTAAGIRDRIDVIKAVEISDEVYQELADQAVALKEAALATLGIAVGRLEKEERDRAELEQLRAAEAQRQADEAERVRKEELRREQELLAAERDRVAAEERERIERERVAAAEAAAQAERDRAEQAARQREQEAAAERQRELDRIEAERAAEREASARELAASQARIAEAERQAQAEREAAQAREQERANQEKAAATERQRLADAQAALERNMEHRATITNAAIEAIVALKVNATTARNIVLAIGAGSIPHVSIKF